MTRVVPLVLAALLGLSGGSCTGCATALLEGTLVADGQGGLAVETAEGNVVHVRWPGDTHVQVDGDHLVLTNLLGFVFAREGEVISTGGGQAFDDATFAACGPIAVRASASPTQ